MAKSSVLNALIIQKLLTARNVKDLKELKRLVSTEEVIKQQQDIAARYEKRFDSFRIDYVDRFKSWLVVNPENESVALVPIHKNLGNELSKLYIKERIRSNLLGSTRFIAVNNCICLGYGSECPYSKSHGASDDHHCYHPAIREDKAEKRIVTPFEDSVPRWCPLDEPDDELVLDEEETKAFLQLFENKVEKLELIRLTGVDPLSDDIYVKLKIRKPAKCPTEG